MPPRVRPGFELRCRHVCWDNQPCFVAACAAAAPCPPSIKSAGHNTGLQGLRNPQGACGVVVFCVPVASHFGRRLWRQCLPAAAGGGSVWPPAPGHTKGGCAAGGCSSSAARCVFGLFMFFGVSSSYPADLNRHAWSLSCTPAEAAYGTCCLPPAARCMLLESH